MFAQMRHMAIVTSNANHEGDFYRDVFGMRRSSVVRAGGAVVVGDGYVGLNLNPRAPGRQAGFDHSASRCRALKRFFAPQGKISQSPGAQTTQQPALRRDQPA